MYTEQLFNYYCFSSIRRPIANTEAYVTRVRWRTLE